MQQPATSTLDRPRVSGNADRKELICFAGCVLISLCLGWLLYSAYPQTIVTGETSTYWGIAKGFRLFSPNAGDWWRHIPYGAILTLVSKCSNPSAAIYWVNTLLFSLNGGLVFLLGTRLFVSIRSGIALAISYIVFEFLSMRIFFMHLCATADPIFAESIYMAILLVLIAWLNGNRKLFILAYAFMGMAIFIKPAGQSYFFVWICFAVLSIWLRPTPPPWKHGTIIASIILLITPHLVWASRNYCVYGYPKGAASGGCSFLQKTLPLIQSGDNVLADPRRNELFIAIAKECKAYNFDTKIWNKNIPLCVQRSYLYNQYFPYTEQPVSPFDFLAGIEQPNLEKRLALYGNSTRMFLLDKQSKAIALEIVSQHPTEYLNEVLFEYVAMFSPQATQPMYWEAIKADPREVYMTDEPDRINTDDHGLYPGRTQPDIRHRNKLVAAALGELCNGRLMKRLLNIYYDNQFWLAHVIFLGSLFLFAIAKSGWKRISDRSLLQSMSVVSMTLFLTAWAYYLTVALIQVAHRRYVIAGGDQELHLMFLIVLVQCLRWFRHTVLFQMLSSRIKQGE